MIGTLYRQRITFAAGFLVVAATAQPQPQNAVTPRPPENAQIISASDPRIRYEGRIDFSNSNAPALIWQASRISADFVGSEVGLRFDNAKGQCFFNAQVDGSNTVVEIREGNPQSLTIPLHAENGLHHLTLFKRNEAASGTVRFRGFELAEGEQLRPPAKPLQQLKMEFIGDSITVGACNEDGESDQWENRRTHNAALSYAALTAAAFNADHRNIAVSGMGIATGWVPMKAGEIWDRLYPETNSPRADLSIWTPQIVFVNFGENDDSYPRAHDQTFPTNFSAGYVALIRAIRKSYPDARLVLLRGGMFGGARSEPLRLAWETAVQKLEAEDKEISHFVFKHWTSTHPRVADDRIMADELIAWLRQQDFMAGYLAPSRTKTDK
jgi:lysophospholipase L1-like esterase